MSANSSGEVEMKYQCDTGKFHKYVGSKSGKEIIFYVERLYERLIPVHTFNAIIHINDRADFRERECSEFKEVPFEQLSKQERYAAAYRNRPFTRIDREVRFEQDRLNAIKFREEQLKLLRMIENSNVFQVNQLGILHGILKDISNQLREQNGNARPKNNNRRSAKKRS